MASKLLQTYKRKGKKIPADLEAAVALEKSSPGSRAAAEARAKAGKSLMASLNYAPTDSQLRNKKNREAVGASTILGAGANKLGG